MKKTLIACLLSLTAAAANAQDSIPLVEHTALGGTVSLLAPVGFGRMSDEGMRLKYPTERRPTEVLSDSTGAINIAFGHTPNAISPAQVAEAHPFIERSIRASHPTARWNRSEVVQRDGRSYIVLDFWSPVPGNEVRNLMLATSVSGRLLIASFNVTKDLESTWGPVGQRIMDSIRVRD